MGILCNFCHISVFILAETGILVTGKIYHIRLYQIHFEIDYKCDVWQTHEH
jgi:hypothetical protein